MRPCSLLELDDSRCHWPLGDAEAVATMFCGGDAVPGRRYCPHHLRRARGQGSAS
jgi:GcrA cell cycle regulator